MFIQLALTLFFLASPALGSGKMSKKGSMSASSSEDEGPTTLTLRITNGSVRQPFAPFFVMSHDGSVDNLYTLGSEATPELASLAETGSPMALVGLYAGQDGVFDIFAFDAGFPYMGGQSLEIDVTVSPSYPMVTIASMAINTNDCFVAINGMKLEVGDVLMLPGLDAGSEENNELCASIPGPACDMTSGNVASGNGEGFVHIHPGIQAIGDLPAGRYEWLNPMVRVAVVSS